jgi:uncharacterized protein involved in exopolysaccharide biosynthesis
MELNSRHRYLLSTLFDYKLYIVLPAAIGAFLALVYVFLFQSQSWTSRQRLMVRDDLLGQAFKPGQFSSFDTMKSRQETILDVARNPEVIRSALQALGPASQSWFSSGEGYPDNSTIEQMQGLINLSAPNGAEFGTTEVVVLSVKAPTEQRSADLILRLLTEVEKKVEMVRVSQLQSMEAELIAARDSARNSLQESIDQLREMEATLGPDSVAMATMTSTMPGDNSIKAELLQILAEKRGFETQLESLKTSQVTLAESQSNPLLVVSSAASFFRDQMKLGELAKSFVEIQKAYAVAAGKYQPSHPTVQDAVEQMNMLKNEIANEFAVLNVSLDSRIQELEHQIARLDDQIDKNHQRLMKLSDKRGEHLAINSEIAKRNEILNQFETNLKNVQSYQQGAGNNVWITRMGDPQVASRPDGLGKRTTVMAGGFLGLLFGFGLVVLLAPPHFQNPTDLRAESVAQISTHGLAATSVDRPGFRSAPAATQSRSSGSSPETDSNRTKSDLQPESNKVQANQAVANPSIEPTAANSRLDMESSQLGNRQTKSSSDLGSSSVSIPNVSQDAKSDHLQSLPTQKQPQPTSRPELASLELAKEATSRMNSEAANTKSPAPEELLAALRAKRALETDPLAKRPSAESHAESGLDSIQRQISKLQQSTGAAGSSTESSLGVSSNVFLNKSRGGEFVNIPNQVQALSGAILGLVEPNPKS